MYSNLPILFQEKRLLTKLKETLSQRIALVRNDTLFYAKDMRALSRMAYQAYIRLGGKPQEEDLCTRKKNKYCLVLRHSFNGPS